RCLLDLFIEVAEPAFIDNHACAGNPVSLARKPVERLAAHVRGQSDIGVADAYQRHRNTAALSVAEFDLDLVSGPEIKMAGQPFRQQYTGWRQADRAEILVQNPA